MIDRKFNVVLPDGHYAALGVLSRWTGTAMADVLREALGVMWVLAREDRQGTRFLIQRGERVTEVLIPGLGPWP